jgi:hypothetical protein
MAKLELTLACRPPFWGEWWLLALLLVGRSGLPIGVDRLVERAIRAWLIVE